LLRAVFLDRDGVINQRPVEGDYIKRWDEFRFLPDVAKAIKILNRNGFKVIVVTNQRGVALGLMTMDDVEEIHKRMCMELQKEGALIDRVYYCPHERDSCDCRKPNIGMFIKAKEDFPEISFTDSFMIGDSISDIEAGKRLSCKCIIIDENLSRSDVNKGYFSARSLYDAVKRYITGMDDPV